METLAVDFSQHPQDDGSKNIYDQIEKKINQLPGPVSLLVNNVGMSISFPDYFVNNDKEYLRKILNCNMLSVTLMSHLVLTGGSGKDEGKGMVPNMRGIIINVGSFAGDTEFAMFAAYSSSKFQISQMRLFNCCFLLRQSLHELVE